MNVRERILRSIEERRSEIVGFLEALVRIPTENPPGRRYRECAALLAERLRALGIDHEVVEIPEDGGAKTGEPGPPEARRQGPAGAPEPDAPESDRRARGADGDGGAPAETRIALLGSHGAGGRTLWFHGHYDVVPAAAQDQFAPRVVKGNLFGRGSSDMKSGLAAMIYAARALADAGAPLDGRVGLCIVPDEETGGRAGSARLARMGLLGRGGAGMLTPEPTAGAVWHANRGAITLRLTVKGRPAHVGMQRRGVNAFEGMLDVAAALRALKAEVEARRTRFRVGPGADDASILMLGGRCEGGTSFNLVPERCVFTVDRRINPEEDLEEEKRRLLGVLDEARRRGVDLEVEVIQEGRSSGAPEDSPLARALAASVEDITGRSPSFEMCPGLLETRFYAEQGIPALAYGPGLLSVSHGPNEFVKLQDVFAAAAVYALTAARLLGPGGGTAAR